jgi:hypothetical protein
MGVERDIFISPWKRACDRFFFSPTQRYSFGVKVPSLGGYRPKEKYHLGFHLEGALTKNGNTIY